MSNTSRQRSQRRFAGARHGRLKRSSALKNVVRSLLTGLLVVAISGIGVAAYAVWDMTNQVQTVDLGVETPDASMFAGSEFEGELSIMLVGSDSREGQTINDGELGELNDVNLLLHVDASHENATIMSFPRDLMIPTPACPGPNGEEGYWSAASERQLNSTLATGGLPCVVRTVEELVGFDIPYAGIVTFDGVINMSNAIGGVEVCLTQPIYDPKADLDLPAGDVTLVGLEALQFLRTRHGVGDGSDKSRISNQQIFMASMVRKLQSAETLTDPAKVYALAKATVENVTLSSSLASVPVLQSIAMTLRGLDLERITFVQYPTFSHPYEEGRLTPDWASAEQVLTLVREGEPFELTATGEGVVAQGEEEGDPATETPGETVEPTEPVEGEDPTAPVNPEETDGPIEISGNVSGQSAAQVTCSQGRTMW